MKNRFIFSLLLILYLIVDYYGYYYGLSRGILSEKIPSKYYLDYGNYDINNPSVSIMDSDMNLFLISKGKNIIIHNKKIKVSKLIGYYFNSKDIIAEIIDDGGTRYNIGILFPHYSFVYYKDIDKTRYKYINLNYSKEYFIRYMYIKIILLVGVIIIFLVNVYIIIEYLINSVINGRVRDKLKE